MIFTLMKSETASALQFLISSEYYLHFIAHTAEPAYSMLFYIEVLRRPKYIDYVLFQKKNHDNEFIKWHLGEIKMKLTSYHRKTSFVCSR